MPGRNLVVAVGWACVALLWAPSTRDARAEFQPGEFVTYSQDSWGAAPTPGNAAQLLQDRFGSVYPGGAVEVGLSGSAGSSIIFTSATAVLNYLPASGGPGPLNADLIDPTSTASGAFGGHVLALRLTIDFEDAGVLGGTNTHGTNYASLQIDNIPGHAELDGMSVRRFLALANHRLGGGSGPHTYEDIAAITRELTLAFEGGTPSQFAQDHLVVPEPCGLAAVAMVAVMLARRPGRSGNVAA